MATIFLKWPDYKGSATAQGYEDWSEGFGLSYEITRQVSQSASYATNREAAHPELSNISFTKAADAASPKLFEASLVGRPAPIEIHLCSAGDKGEMRPYLRFMLHDCVVSSYQLSGAEQEAPLESIALSFLKIEYEFDVYKKDNKTLDSTIKTQYDLGTNVLA